MLCPVCERDCPDDYMSKHHLRTRKVDMKATEYLCRDCHHYIHALFTNKQLAKPDLNLDTIEGLLQQPEYRKAVAFIRKRSPGGHIAIHQAKNRRRK